MGDNYFQFRNHELQVFQDIFAQCEGRVTEPFPIAYVELLAATVGIICISPRCAGQIVRLNCDNAGAVAWLQKSRCSRDIGFRILVVIELYKHRHCLKVCAHHILGEANTSADFLSRGMIPPWPQKHVVKCTLNLSDDAILLVDPLSAWRDILSS